MSTLTIMGLLRFNPNLFSELVLPDGIETDLLVDNIIERGGDYEVIYPNAELMQRLIGSWSRRWLPVFENWNKATNDMSEINPLDNYDRHESWTDNQATHSTTNDTMSGTGYTSGHDSSSGGGTVNEVSKISADDVAEFVNKDSNTQSNTTHTSNDTSTNSSTSTQNNATSDGTNNSTHEGHIWGNVGVTTSATMYKEFYDVIRQYGNIYDSIATVFCQSFVIPIL